MGTTPRTLRLQFAGFELDPTEGQLRRDGVPVKIAAQPFRALVLLTQRPQQLVSRDELRQALWGEETVVDFEHGLNTCIRQVRAALGEEADTARLIETVPRLGYRFKAPVRMTEAGLRRRLTRSAAAAAVFIVIVGSGIAWLAWGPRRVPTIAVLPFTNLGIEAGGEDFTDGVTDELIHSRAMIDGLEVRSRTSSFAFRGKPRDLREVAGLLGVGYVVEGSVLRSGDQLRITAHFVRAADDVSLWSGRFDRQLKDIFSIQDEISLAIVNQLRLKLGRGQRRYTANASAYEVGQSLVYDVDELWRDPTSRGLSQDPNSRRTRALAGSAARGGACRRGPRPFA